MEAYQQRVVDEKADLDVKLEALRSFIAGSRFEAVQPHEQARMRRQHVAMVEYSTVLGERIAAF